jgi:hypothetical protein
MPYLSGRKSENERRFKESNGRSVPSGEGGKKVTLKLNRRPSHPSVSSRESSLSSLAPTLAVPRSPTASEASVVELFPQERLTSLRPTTRRTAALLQREEKDKTVVLVEEAGSGRLMQVHRKRGRGADFVPNHERANPSHWDTKSQSRSKQTKSTTVPQRSIRHDGAAEDATLSIGSSMLLFKDEQSINDSPLHCYFDVVEAPGTAAVKEEDVPQDVVVCSWVARCHRLWAQLKAASTAPALV